ncbi:hypothetical protein [Campylobacter coli]|uniref:hypothetical protein n=1 Tax=Campylobacter coli TaxID=195 RepID=UPI001F40396A|nr:hypothetical protein [Campylobacter coli]
MIWKKDDLIKIEKYNIIEEENKYYIIELDKGYLLERLTCKAPNDFSKNDICFFKEEKDAEWKNCSQENFELNEDILEINLYEKYNIQFLKINKFVTDIEVFIRRYKGLIIACRIDSFACRIFAILNAFYLAELHNMKPGFLWRARNFKTQNIELNMQDEAEMFDENFIAEYSYYNPNIEQYMSKDCFNSAMEIRNVKELVKPYKYFWGYDCAINSLIVKPFQSNFFKYRDSLRNIWKSIKFIPKYQSIVDGLTKIKLDSFVAIHIRNGEAILSDIYKPVIFMDAQIERIFPVELAIELIKRLLIEKKKVIIFGSDQELLRAIKSFICNEHLYLSTDFIKEDLDYFGQVIFDIILMSKADYIYRPNVTLYSELAFMIGECKEILNVNQCFTLQEQFEIVYNNLGKYPIGKLHKASSCAYLYKILFEIDKYDFRIADKILKKSLEWDNALIYKLMYLDLLLKNSLWIEAEFFLRQNMDVVKIEELITLIATLNFAYKGGKKEYLTPNSFCFVIEEFMCSNYYKKYPCLYYLFSKLISKYSIYFDPNKNLRNIAILDEKYIWTLSEQLTDIQYSAKSRIRNHLSYKLGEAMIENSKSLLGYIRIPYVLSCIKDKHKQEQQQYQEAIKKNPNLKLPALESYPDYKESLKEKECFTYKLGEALIKADKTWYKGGYVKLWFEVRKLKK